MECRRGRACRVGCHANLLCHNECSTHRRETARAQHEELLHQIASEVSQPNRQKSRHDAALNILGMCLKVDNAISFRWIITAKQLCAGEYHRATLIRCCHFRPTIPIYNWLSEISGPGSHLPHATFTVKCRSRATQKPVARSSASGTHGDSSTLRRSDRKRSCLATEQSQRNWTEADISLAKDAAGHMGLALGTAMIRERERHIAYILQDALLPSLPPNLPGLDIATHYKAALRESSIGGDFYDRSRSLLRRPLSASVTCPAKDLQRPHSCRPYEICFGQCSIGAI